MKRFPVTPAARAINRALAFAVALVVAQLGLFSVAWEESLAHHFDRAIPCFLLSAACFGANLLVLRRLQRLDGGERDGTTPR